VLYCQNVEIANMTIEESIIQGISYSLRFFTNTPTGHKFACPYCQCGSKDHKGRPMTVGRIKGSLYQVSEGIAWNYRCFRCNKRVSFTKFLEDHFPRHFEAYVRQRDALGTTGKHTNCPKLETVLKRQGVLPENPPDFSWQGTLPPAQKRPPGASGVHQCPPVIPNSPAGTKITKLPPMKSPSQQSGCQARINQVMKQRAKRRLEQSGELW
jgi:hypothetical protein